MHVSAFYADVALSFFSRSHSAANSRGPRARGEGQRVRAQDQRRHREGLHSAGEQLLCRRRGGPRRLSGNSFEILALSFERQIASRESRLGVNNSRFKYEASTSRNYFVYFILMTEGESVIYHFPSTAKSWWRSRNK